MQFSNMSEHVEESLNMLKNVYTCSDSIWYQLLRFIGFSNMSEHVFKHVETRNENMMKYSKIWANGTKKVCDKAIPWIASSKSSDQKNNHTNLTLNDRGILIHTTNFQFVFYIYINTNLIIKLFSEALYY